MKVKAVLLMLLLCLTGFSVAEEENQKESVFDSPGMILERPQYLQNEGPFVRLSSFVGGIFGGLGGAVVGIPATTLASISFALIDSTKVERVTINTFTACIYGGVQAGYNITGAPALGLKRVFYDAPKRLISGDSTEESNEDNS